jgi:hypothetical protein
MGLAIVLCLAGCVTARGDLTRVNNGKPDLPAIRLQQYGYMVGKWMGEATTDDGLFRRELVEHNADGTYRDTFRTYHKDGSYEESVEVGEWGISGNIYFTLMKGWMVDGEFRPSDAMDPSFDDAYTIIELTDKLIRYKSVETGDEYVDHKVDADYILPEKP